MFLFWSKVAKKVRGVVVKAHSRSRVRRLQLEWLEDRLVPAGERRELGWRQS
jgi:hypothetical protein